MMRSWRTLEPAHAVPLQDRPASGLAMTEPLKREPRRTYPQIVTVVESSPPAPNRKRTLGDYIFGRRLATAEEDHQNIAPRAGVPVLGLDALSSAAYGPEAALTLLLPLGVVGLGYVVPISAVIVTVLLIVYFSYRQTIAAYPNGGGSYTVAKENLGPVRCAAGPGRGALALDYVLNVAVGISAGVGALVSAAPSLLPYTVPLCLGILTVLTIVNLRGTRESGLTFLLPTYLFVATLGVILVVGGVKVALAGGHPAPVVAGHALAAPAQAVSLLAHHACVRQAGVRP